MFPPLVMGIYEFLNIVSTASYSFGSLTLPLRWHTTSTTPTLPFLRFIHVFSHLSFGILLISLYYHFLINFFMPTTVCSGSFQTLDGSAVCPYLSLHTLEEVLVDLLSFFSWNKHVCSMKLLL